MICEGVPIAGAYVVAQKRSWRIPLLAQTRLFGKSIGGRPHRETGDRETGCRQTEDGETGSRQIDDRKTGSRGEDRGQGDRVQRDRDRVTE